MHLVGPWGGCGEDPVGLFPWPLALGTCVQVEGGWLCCHVPVGGSHGASPAQGCPDSGWRHEGGPGVPAQLCLSLSHLCAGGPSATPFCARTLSLAGVTVDNLCSAIWSGGRSGSFRHRQAWPESTCGPRSSPLKRGCLEELEIKTYAVPLSIASQWLPFPPQQREGSGLDVRQPAEQTHPGVAIPGDGVWDAMTLVGPCRSPLGPMTWILQQSLLPA